MKNVIITSILQGFGLEKPIFEGCSGFELNNLELAYGMPSKCYTNVAKCSELKIRKFFRLISTFAKVTGEKLVGGFFSLRHPE